MAVDGLPDPKLHAICRKCLQWFPRHEGDRIWPPVTGVMSFVKVRAAKLADAEQLKEFWCRGCQARQTERSTRSYRSAIVTLLVVGLVAAALWWTGAWREILATFGPR